MDLHGRVFNTPKIDKHDMFQGLFTAPLCVADLFADPFRFAVPSFQRRFAWTVKEAAQLLDDIQLAMGTDEENGGPSGYFLGAILLTDPGGVESWRHGVPTSPRTLDIIDGQQRLTTLVILLAALRDVSAALSDDVVFDLNKLLMIEGGGPYGRDVFRLNLRRDDAVMLERYVLEADACNLSHDTDNISPGDRAILDVRDHFVRELRSFSQDERQRLSSFLLRACHVVAIVTTDLDHGHRMFSVLNDRGRPLARKDILKAEILGGIPFTRAAIAEQTWEDLERRLGGEFDTFFSYLRTIKGKSKLPIIAGVRAVKEDAGGSEPFLFDVLLPLAEAFEIIHCGQHQGASQSDEITRRLDYLSWLGSSEWVPPTVQWFSLMRDDPAQILRYLDIIEPFSYALRLQCIGAAKRATRCNGLLTAIARGTILDPERSPCVLTRDEQRHITANLRNLHERHPQTCKLVLLRINDELAGAPQNLNPADWTVEHVLPQNPGRGGQWRTWFADPDERERLTQSIGNLVLIRRTQNDKASNQDFARKKAIYFAPGDTGVLAITEDLRDLDVWTPAEIEKRELRFLRILEEVWRLDLSGVPGGDNNEMRGRRRRAGGKSAEAVGRVEISEP